MPVGIIVATGDDGQTLAAERAAAVAPLDQGVTRYSRRRVRRTDRDSIWCAGRACVWMRSSMNTRCGGCCPRVEGVVISVAPGTKVYLVCQPVSMRLGFDGLAARVSQLLLADPFCGHLFLFRAKRADYLKILYYDGSGLCLFAKRLESGRFVWPPIVDGQMTLTPAQLALLPEAMDWRRTVALEPPRKPVMV